ncbi:MAG: trigger factor [Eubacteriales bacterium]|nr:trigger factor [Eubacteriales bacterium]
MASKVEKLDNANGRLTIEVEPNDFRKAIEEAYHKNRQRFSIPGFRKGKAPFPMVLNYYGEGVFYEDAVDSLLDPHYRKALEEHEVEPYSRPDVDILEIGLDKGLIFTADYALKPQVRLGNYKGFTAYRPSDSVTDDEITQALDAKRFELSRLVPVTDRPVKEDDHVVIDYEGSVDGVPFDGGKAENYTLEIGSGQFIPGFEEAIIGHSVGEEFDIDVTFPEEYHSEELAGKAAVFHIVLHEIKERQTPELDDDFIKDISEDCDTVEEYRKQKREEMEAERKRQADAEFLQRILEQVAKEAEFEISDRLVQAEAHRLLDRQRNYMAYNGIPFDYYLQMMGQTEAQVLKELETPALEAIKHDLSLEAVADAEGFEASQEEVNELIEDLAKRNDMEVDEFKSHLGEDYEEQFKEEVRLNKASDFLRENSEATDKLPEDEDEDLEDDADEEAAEATDEPAEKAVEDQGEDQ